MAHTPDKITEEQARLETLYAWERSYSPERNLAALNAIAGEPLQYRISHLVSRLFFRGIYFPQMNKRAWLKLLFDNRKAITGLTKEGVKTWRNHRKNRNSDSNLNTETSSVAIESEF
jgi:hypothetical protein